MDHINEKIKDVIERKKFLFLTNEIATEHIYDALQEHYRSWRIGYNESIDLAGLKQYLELKYSDRINANIVYVGSQSNSNLKTVYQSVTYLLSNNVLKIDRIFPIMPKETDVTFEDSLFHKLQIVFSLMPTTFDAYMYYAFPSLKTRITFWNGFDIISVNFLKTKSTYFIAIHSFKRTDGISEQPQLIITKDFKHELYQGFLGQGSYKDLQATKFNLNGISYKLSQIEGDNIHRIIKKFSIHNQLYKFLARRFNNYLPSEWQISPSTY